MSRECMKCGWFNGHDAKCEDYGSATRTTPAHDVPDIVELLPAEGYVAVDVTGVSAGGIEAVVRKVREGADRGHD